MPVSNKHGEAMTQKIYPMFNGGLNLKLPPESLEANELSEAMNVELSPVTGAIRSRGGLVWDATMPNGSEIEDIVPIPGYHGFLIRTTNGQLYTDIWHTLWPVTGTLSGNDKMSVALFSDTGKCMVASGGKLQVLSPYEKSLEIIENSPDNCRLVCVKEGRVCVVDGDSTLRFSWVGDYENWAEFNDVQSSDRACNPEIRQQVLKMAVDCTGTRATGRILGIAKDTVTSILKRQEGVIWQINRNYLDAHRDEEIEVAVISSSQIEVEEAEID